MWEQTEWSLSHHCLSPPHYREALWPLFSPIIHARAPSPALWWCDSYPVTPKPLHSDGTSKLLPASYPTPHQATSLTSEAFTQTEEEGSLKCTCPPNRRKDRGGTQLCGIVWRQAASITPAGRQRSERPDIMLMEAFGSFVHDFTPHCSSQLSDTVTGAQWEACNLNKAEKILSQRY